MPVTRRRLLMPLRRYTEVAPGLTVNRRISWTDVVPDREPEPEDVRFLLVHHTADSSEHRPGEVPDLLRGMQRLHVDNRGWNDIAYNFVIDRHGGVWEGRYGSLAGPVRGDATGGNQGFSQLVCLIGDFTRQPPTEDALRALVLTLAWLADRYSVEVSPGSKVEFVSRGSNRWPEGAQIVTPPVAGHRDMSLTACPGEAFYPLIAERIVPELRRLGTATTTSPPSTAPSAPPSTATSTPGTTAPVAATSTSTLPTTGPVAPETTVAASPLRADGSGPIGWGLLPLAGGLLAVLLTWRMRRMNRRPRQRSP